jgi:hypothetical protein
MQQRQRCCHQAASHAIISICCIPVCVDLLLLQLVSQELIRIAILWHEMWHEALEEASRLYFGESNVEAMLGVLLPLHELMEKTGPSTLKEIAFVQVCWWLHVQSVAGCRRSAPLLWDAVWTSQWAVGCWLVAYHVQY